MTAREDTDHDAEFSLSASRTLRILSSFTEVRLDLGVSELSNELSLSKASVSRFLYALQRHGYVDRDPQTRRYRPGVESFRVGQLFLKSGGLQQRARPLMADLVNRTGYTAYLSTLHGEDVVILASIEGQGRIRYSIPVGEKLPVHSTATGQAALAMLDRSQIEGIVRKLPLERRTPDTIVDIDRLLARIEVTRRQGYGLNWQENTPGVASVAAAAKDPTGTSPIVLSLGFSTSQTTRARCKELGRLVRSAIDALPDPLRHERGDRA